ncbi:hypothetical protein [Zhihengliuella flava]|uniref:Uncharacterized protein n=1 Tax=Zhihengliuella flava TaxID=1285193 RepID=A0A931DA87_9MICC|nr:hypothetical protein [Zhihengliuella flava]MBG6085312.1 hypothetical protein [Zhihengliuella flava]
MSSEFDAQLIESVTVRRARLTDGLLYGTNPTERRWASPLKQFLISIVVAALIAAVCVGVSFVKNIFEQRAAEQEELRSSAVLVVVDQRAPGEVFA